MWHSRLRRLRRLLLLCCMARPIAAGLFPGCIVGNLVKKTEAQSSAKVAEVGESASRDESPRDMPPLRAAVHQMGTSFWNYTPLRVAEYMVYYDWARRYPFYSTFSQSGKKEFRVTTINLALSKVHKTVNAKLDECTQNRKPDCFGYVERFVTNLQVVRLVGPKIVRGGIMQSGLDSYQKQIQEWAARKDFTAEQKAWLQKSQRNHMMYDGTLRQIKAMLQNPTKYRTNTKRAANYIHGLHADKSRR
jgi:hypothetical protein